MKVKGGFLIWVKGAPPKIGRERLMREVEEWRNIQVMKYRFIHVCVQVD